MFGIHIFCLHYHGVWNGPHLDNHLYIECFAAIRICVDVPVFGRGIVPTHLY